MEFSRENGFSLIHQPDTPQHMLLYVGFFCIAEICAHGQTHNNISSIHT